MKIGILTYHRAVNYGAFLQAYGLCQRLNQEPDIEAEIIDYRMEKEMLSYDYEKRSILWKVRHFPTYRYKKKLEAVFKIEQKKLPLSKDSLVSDSFEDFRNFVYNKYDFIIAGSDEIWKVDGFRGYPTPYWLPGDLGCGKVSYAASSRTDFSKLDKEILKTIREYLNDFLFISVRDDLTKSAIQEYIHPSADVEVFPDPSFVYDFKADGKKGREHIAALAGFDPAKKIMLVMMENKDYAEQIRKEFAEEYQIIAVFSRKRNYKNVSELGPFEWLDAIAGADLVCTSYFHAVCFSIIYQTPFLAFGTDGKESKLFSVMNESKNMDRLLTDKEKICSDGYLKQKIEELSSVRVENAYVSTCKKRFEEYVSILRSLKRS